MENSEALLNQVREDIDAIDSEIQKLIVQRAEKVKDVSRIKKQESNAVFYRPEREAAVLKKIMARDCGALPAKEVAKIFREIMSACLALQKPMEIAFLGPTGTFSQIAAKKHFGFSLHEVFCENIPGIFQAVNDGKANYGVVPIENSIGGLVDITLNQFIDSSLTICGEVTIEVKQCLLSNTTAEQIHKIYSHQQSLLQCETWLMKNYPKAELIGVASNSQGAKRAAEEPNAAAIAGEHCAELYHLKVIAKDIENNSNNYTRFLIIGQHQPKKSGDDRTTLLIKVQDAPGTLEKLINPLAKNSINITMIRSKPANTDLSAYYFFLDLDCYIEDPGFICAHRDLVTNHLDVKILGSYPKAVI